MYKEIIKKRQKCQKQSRQKIAQKVNLFRDFKQTQKRKRQKLIIKEQILNKLNKSCNVNQQRIIRNMNLLETQQRQHILNESALKVAFTKFIAQKQRRKQEKKTIKAHKT